MSKTVLPRPTQAAIGGPFNGKRIPVTATGPSTLQFTTGRGWCGFYRHGQWNDTGSRRVT